MSRLLLSSLSIATLIMSAGLAHADGFNRIATFHVIDNLPKDADQSKPTVAEIVAATKDGMMLAYTDSPGNRLGLIDIQDPKSPKAAGIVALGGEPTSVVISGKTALVGVVTSKSFNEPSGHIAVVDLETKAVKERCDLTGQPDSLTLSPDGRYLAVAIENERDEKVNDGAIPQLPPGNLTSFMLKEGVLQCASRKIIELTGLASVAGEDPEPEFVDINTKNEAVVTLQENNHIVIVDLASGKIAGHFSAGSVDLSGIDTKKDGVISLTGEMKGVAREPDAVRWLDDNRFVTADEGDWKGGSRSFTIFNRDGSVAYNSGNTLDHLAVRLGHYPDNRNKKGVEPEGIATGTYGGKKLFFVGAERSSLISVYEDNGAEPRFLQALPGGSGPEGLLTIAQRNLFVASAEADNRKKGGIGSLVTIYSYGPDAVAYPMILSDNDAKGLPIAFGAMSGLAAHPKDAGKLYAVTDSFYATARILTIDAQQKPAKIIGEMTVTQNGKPAADLDIEGVVALEDGSFWLASEGNPEKEKNKTNSKLVKISAKGEIETIVELPDSLLAQASRFGFEGITATGNGADLTLWIAVQRGWKDDPKGVTRLLSYKPATNTWGQLHYPLEKASEGAWIGLSEITAVKDGFVVIERDNLIGPDAKTKLLTHIKIADMKPVPLDAKDVPVVKKTILRNLIPDLLAAKGYVHDKVEGFAVDKAGHAFIITDNDGVDGTSGETQFINLGKLEGIAP